MVWAKEMKTSSCFGPNAKLCSAQIPIKSNLGSLYDGTRSGCIFIWGFSQSLVTAHSMMARMVHQRVFNSLHLTCTAKIRTWSACMSHIPCQSLHSWSPGRADRIASQCSILVKGIPGFISNTCWSHWGEWLSVQAAYRLTVPCLHVQTALLFKHRSVKLSNLVKVSCQSQKR